jgi:alpha-D-ribose 1-methylphosphonate 5-triphosphate synthase subunit PhnH
MTATAPKAQSTPGGGFADPVQASQAVFRAVMQALAEPGTAHDLPAHVLAGLDPPAPLSLAAAAILLTLADFETPVNVPQIPGTAEIAAYLRFHAGCPIVADCCAAAFAFVTDAVTLNDFDAFAQGSLEYPDRSTTLVVQVASLVAGDELTLQGPGIAASRAIRLSPLHPDLPQALAANRERFPRGVDLIFTDGRSILGLPRSTRVVTQQPEG